MIKVTILGVSSAKPTIGRHQSSQVVNVNEQYFLVDAGENAQRQMAQAGISPLKIRKVFISHLHGDHIFGLFPLLSTMNLLGRRTALEVYGPKNLGPMLDWYRTNFEVQTDFEVAFHEVDTTKYQKIFENRTMEVWSLPLRHQLPCTGYIFREKQKEKNVDKLAIEKYSLSIKDVLKAKQGEDILLPSGEVLKNESITFIKELPRSYAYVSDTSRSMMVARRISNVSVVYHEATYTQEFQKIARKRGHSSALDAAQVAQRAGAERLYIGHFSSRYKDLTPLLEEAREFFPNCQLAKELETFTV
ncbi:MAG: ribonuclease Z [Alistipes sp.]|nr:ribonuclease Z [Candidatus Alistipes equi]